MPRTMSRPVLHDEPTVDESMDFEVIADPDGRRWVRSYSDTRITWGDGHEVALSPSEIMTLVFAVGCLADILALPEYTLVPPSLLAKCERTTREAEAEHRTRQDREA